MCLGPVSRDGSGRVRPHNIGIEPCAGTGRRVATLPKTERAYEKCGVCNTRFRLRQKNPVLPRHRDAWGFGCPGSGRRAAIHAPLRLIEESYVGERRPLPPMRERLNPTPNNGPVTVRVVRGGLPSLGRRR